VEEELAKLAEAQRRTEEQVQALTEAQRRIEQQVEALTQQVQALAEAQRRTEEQVQALTEAQRRIEQQVADLVAAQQRTERILQRLLEWQQGEAGRREGERYERRIVVRAPNLFFGGEGGAPGEPDVRRQLSRWLHPFYREGRAPDPPADPLLADLIWWKGEEVFVVEVSQKVDPQDIHRARQRADTLREAGVNATPAVIGEEWATPESQALAQQESVEWLVGGGLSQGFLRFRRLSAETLENPPREG
jgi:exonuclease VII large subunit